MIGFVIHEFLVIKISNYSFFKKDGISFGKFYFKKVNFIFFKNHFHRILSLILKFFWPSVLNLVYRQGYRYGVLYRPIPITDTDRKFSYRQNRLSADNQYIGRYRYRYSIGSYTDPNNKKTRSKHTHDFQNCSS